MIRIFAIVRRFLRAHAGTASIETSLSLSLFVAPMCLLGIESYAFKTSVGEMARDSYHIALALAANPDVAQSDSEITTRFRTKFPADEYALDITTYCSCMSAIVTQTVGTPGTTCPQDCPSEQRVRWKKVTVTGTYDPLVSKALIGNRDLTVSRIIRTS